MFAFLSLGTQEILILGVLGVLLIGVPIVVCIAVVRASKGSGRAQALEEENRNLRDRLDDNRRRPD